MHTAFSNTFRSVDLANGIMYNLKMSPRIITTPSGLGMYSNLLILLRKIIYLFWFFRLVYFMGQSRSARSRLPL